MIRRCRHVLRGGEAKLEGDTGQGVDCEEEEMCAMRSTLGSVLDYGETADPERGKQG